MSNYVEISEWTRDEERTLRKLFKSNSNSFIANKLGRSVGSVESKARRLSLTPKSKRYLRSLGRDV